MKDFKEERALTSFLSSRWLFFSLIIMSAWLVRSGWEAYRRAQIAQEKREHLETQIDRLAGRQIELERKLDGFSRGEGIEEEARDKLFLKRPEEEVVIIVE